MTTTTTQVAAIRTHLAAGKSITPALAMTVYGISRLASVIEDLRRAGSSIDSVLRRDEMGKQYAEYRLRVEPRMWDQVQVRPGHGIGLPQYVKRTKGINTVVRLIDDAVLVEFDDGVNSPTEHWLNRREVVVSNRIATH